MIRIPLTRGYFALIDDCDLEIVSQFKWYAMVMRRKDGSTRNVYAACRRPSLLMHRLILGNPDIKMHVDHRNRVGLDNWRNNLRVCTPSQNAGNSLHHIDNGSGLKGVGWHKASGAWRARICINYCTHYLGTFKSKEDAARAYDEAAKEHFGEFAILNYQEGQSA